MNGDCWAQPIKSLKEGLQSVRFDAAAAHFYYMCRELVCRSAVRGGGSLFSWHCFSNLAQAIWLGRVGLLWPPGPGMISACGAAPAYAIKL